jgi:hypothetical protein
VVTSSSTIRIRGARGGEVTDDHPSTRTCEAEGPSSSALLEVQVFFAIRKGEGRRESTKNPGSLDQRSQDSALEQAASHPGSLAAIHWVCLNVYLL